MTHGLHIASLLMVACSAFATTYSVKSPDGLNEIVLNAEHALTISIMRNNTPIVAPTEIALELQGGETLGLAPHVKDMQVRAIDDVIHNHIYKKSQIVAKGNQKTITFDGNYSVTLAAFNDGVAYRWETSRTGEITIVNEKGGLVAAKDYHAFITYGNGDFKGDRLQVSWENLYTDGAISSIDTKQLIFLPLYIKTDAGVLVMSETDLADYPGMNFFKVEGKTAFTACFAKYPDQTTIEDTQRHRRIHGRQGFIAKTQGTRTFPWRTFTLAATPAHLINADLNYTLATPSVLRDTSWIKPGKVAWDWWNDWNVKHVNFRAGCNTETYKFYIDFAAKHNIEYVILDEGWSKHLKIMEISDEVDLVELFKYAAKKEVGLILWASWPQLYNRQEEVIKKYAEMGAKGFKIDFFDRDDQDVVRYLEETAKVAAKYKVLVDYHGIFKPAGLQRKYPNIINYEAVFGLEQLKWGDNKRDFMRHDTILPFTRMVAGPMDYTPGAMLNATKSSFAANWAAPMSQGTRVHQMALLVMLEAPLQMLCDSPSNYLDNPACTAFMADIPTVWDETIGIAGEPGKNCVIARRKGDEWYIAAIGNWDAQEITIDLAPILKKGRWTAEIFKDGVNADRDAKDWAFEKTKFHAADKLTISLKPGGGWVGHFE